MLHARIVRFDVIVTVALFEKSFYELNEGSFVRQLKKRKLQWSQLVLGWYWWQGPGRRTSVSLGPSGWMCKLKSHDELVTLSLTGEPDLEASKIGWVAVNDNLSSSVLKLPMGRSIIPSITWWIMGSICHLIAHAGMLTSNLLEQWAREL